jgi:hypothetical protein
VPAVFILVLRQTPPIGMGTLRVALRDSPANGPGPLWATLGGIVTVLLVLYLLQAAFMFLVAFRLYGLPLETDLVRAIALALPTTFGIRGFVQIGEMDATLAGRA